MTSRKEQEIPQSEVAKFYEGKTILLTGASGFVGTILLEILLRCCPGVHRIYILLREKRGMLPEERKEVLFKKDIFYKVKEKYPHMLDKVTVIPGDVSHKNLGMNDDYLRKVAEEVSIVFHVAAEVVFLKTLRHMLLQNVIATYNIIELCRKLKHVDALVYTSTAYSNSYLRTIDEIIYKMPFKIEDFLKTIRKSTEEELNVLFENCTPTFPNFYTFSKCAAENLLAETAADLPVSIVRPSVVVCTWKGCLPGYIEDGSALYNFSVGIGKGFIRVIQVDKNLLVDTIPVDIVANTHIVAAWRQVRERLPSPFVYNCTSTDVVPCTWKEFTSIMFEVAVKHPLPNSYQRPGLKILKSSMAYWFHSILDHYLPAIVIDNLLRLSGRKPRLLRLYRFYDKMMAMMVYFRVHDFEFRSANFQSLESKINSTDSEIFPVDIRKYSIQEMREILPTGCSIFNWKNDKKTYEERMRTTYMRYLMTSFIKWFFIGLLIFICYKIIF